MKSHRPPLPRLVAAACAGALLATLGPLMPPAHAEATTRALSLVQLGDSYSAGNGAGDYYDGPGDKGKYRSYNSWARK